MGQTAGAELSRTFVDEVGKDSNKETNIKIKGPSRVKFINMMIIGMVYNNTMNVFFYDNTGCSGGGRCLEGGQCLPLGPSLHPIFSIFIFIQYSFLSNISFCPIFHFPIFFI